MELCENYPLTASIHSEKLGLCHQLKLRKEEAAQEIREEITHKKSYGELGMY